VSGLRMRIGKEVANRLCKPFIKTKVEVDEVSAMPILLGAGNPSGAAKGSMTPFPALCFNLH
jgi:hypothetical protein